MGETANHIALSPNVKFIAELFICVCGFSCGESLCRKTYLILFYIKSISVFFVLTFVLSNFRSDQSIL